jgi:hypothetical protein
MSQMLRTVGGIVVATSVFLFCCNPSNKEVPETGAVAVPDQKEGHPQTITAAVLPEHQGGYPRVKTIRGTSTLIAFYGQQKDNLVTEGLSTFVTPAHLLEFVNIHNFELDKTEGQRMEAVARMVLFNNVDNTYRSMTCLWAGAVQRYPNLQISLPLHFASPEKYGIRLKAIRDGDILLKDLAASTVAINGRLVRLEDTLKEDWREPVVPPEGKDSITPHEEMLYTFLKGAFAASVVSTGTGLSAEFTGKKELPATAGPIAANLLFLRFVSERLPKFIRRTEVIQYGRDVLLITSGFETTNQVWVDGYFSRVRSTWLDSVDGISKAYGISTPVNRVSAEAFMKGNLRLDGFYPD